MLDKEFYRERLGHFDYRVPEDFWNATSVIVVAIPRPQSQAVFNWNGESYAFIIPPTYVANEKTRKQMKRVLTKVLAAKGYHVAPATLPLKLLAVRSGLSSYGRNNISYVPGMGSFLQLVALYSDLPCKTDSWQQAQMMKSCENCRACYQNCPTNAIPNDRFLLRAERCISFHNEKKGHIPFPAWIEPSAHSCIVGCMVCQRVCPQNRKFLQWIEEKEKFSQEETELLLKETSCDRLPAKTKRKLQHLDLLEDIDSLPRNLSVLFKK